MKDVNGKEITLDVKVKILPQYLTEEEKKRGNAERVYTVDSLAWDSSNGYLIISDKYGGHSVSDYMLEIVEDIFSNTVQKVKDGSKFYVNLRDKSLKVDGKFIIEKGKYEGELGIEMKDIDDIIKDIEMYYTIYKHSVPSERSESHRRTYFKALLEKELNEEDMLYGIRREEARCELELYILCSILNGSLTWEELAKDNEDWFFWQSKQDKDLIIMKSWITQ